VRFSVLCWAILSDPVPKTDEDFLFAASPPYEMTSRDLID
jgi:hypothetical protein